MTAHMTARNKEPAMLLNECALPTDKAFSLYDIRPKKIGKSINVAMR